MTYDTSITRPDGITVRKWTDDSKRLHRNNAPAEEHINKSGIIVKEIWYQHGKLHRIDKPALITRNDNNEIETFHYYQIIDGESKLHRNDGPAISITENNRLIYKSWYEDGYMHRTDGPAEISLYGSTWHINGKMFDSYTRNKIEKWIEDNGFTVPLSVEEQALFLLTFG